MKNFRILAMTVAGLLVGVLTGCPWPQRPSYGDPADTDYRAHQVEARAARRPERQSKRISSSPEAATAFVKALQDAPYDIGLLSHESRNDFSIDQRGQLRDPGLKDLGIPLEAKPRLQKIIDAAISQATEDMLTRVRPVARGADAGKGRAVYDIPADIEAGKVYLEQAERDFATVVDPDQAMHLRKSMEDLLSAFGRQSVRINVDTDPSTGEVEVCYGGYNPYIGAEQQKSQITQDPMNRGPLDDLVEKVVSREK